MSKTIVIGLTGPMGSGKSTVAKTFCDNGYKLIDADKLARRVVEKGSKTLELLAHKFGDDIINADGSLDRAKLSQRAFANSDSTKTLNSITHPAILELVKAEIAHYSTQGYTKIIYDAPLLFESESHLLCDAIVSVVADKKLRTNRVLSRDKISEKEVERRFIAQHDDSFYTEQSDYVITNNGSNDELINNTLAVIHAIDEVYHGTI